MAAQKTKSRRSSTSRKSSNGRTSSSSRRSSNGRSASQKPEKYRFAQNVNGDETAAEREYRSYATSDDPAAAGQDPDVLLDVPVVKVDRIHLKVEELEARVSLNAKVLDLVTLDVGVDVHLGKLEIEIEGVEAQALVKVRLDHVAAIVDRTLTTIDRNPELVKSLGQAIEDVGQGAGQTLGEAGEAVEDVGEGAEGAVDQVGQGAGQAVGELGEGAGEAAGQLGQGAGQAVGEAGQGAGQAVGNLDQVAGQLGQGAGQAAGGLGQAAGQLGQGAGQLGQGAGQAAGQLGQGAEQLAQGAQGAGAGGPAQAAKQLAKELGSAAADEAKDIGQAATLKAKEMAERRRRKRAEKHDATESALELADELGVDLDDVKGTGAKGRITVRDVKKADRDG
jgi:pyruvate/2-oxoglutarate dehydrogenase complex dihydrolipoamide acyltransferase (E2) component